MTCTITEIYNIRSNNKCTLSLLLLHTSDRSAFCGTVIEVVHMFRTVVEHETSASGPHSLKNKQQEDICLKYEFLRGKCTIETNLENTEISNGNNHD